MNRLFAILIILIAAACNNETTLNDLQKEKWNGKIKSITTSTFFYDSTKAEPHLGKLINKTIRLFNESGNETSCTLVNEEDEVESIKKYGYNKNNLKSELKETDEEGNLLSTANFSYNKNQLISEIISVDNNTNETNRLVNNYDKNNNISFSISYNGKNEMEYKIENSYDDSKQLIEERIFLGNGQLDYKSTYLYDEKGRVTINRGYASDRSKLWEIKNEYTSFDKEGNWIAKHIFKDGKLINVVQVQIEYFQ